MRGGCVKKECMWVRGGSGALDAFGKQLGLNGKRRNPNLCVETSLTSSDFSGM